MKLFRLRRKSNSGQEERELVLDTDAEVEAEAPADTLTPDAEAEAEAPADAPAPDAEPAAEAPAPEGDLMTQISAETDSEIEAEEKTSEEDPLDPDLLNIFREAKNEVEESTLASELEDIAAQDLLTDLVGVSHRLRTTSWGRGQPNEGKK